MVIAIIAVLPVPTGLESHTSLYFAVFTGVIVGLILEPVPGAVVAMIGISIIAVLSPWLLFSPEQLAQDGFKFTAKIAVVGGIWILKLGHLADLRGLYVWYWI